MYDAVEAVSKEMCAFEADVLFGLSCKAKQLPCKWLYDDLGSELFESITQLPEYYPTRTETEILNTRIGDLQAFAGDRSAIVEYGAGAGIKTRILIDALKPAGYVAIDVAEDFLAATVDGLRLSYPALPVTAVTADFTQTFDLPAGVLQDNRLGFFPGSTIGNLDSLAAEAFLRQMRRQLGAGAKAIIGADLIKDLAVLVPAYDDAQGVTAAFNLNLLRRINRELGANFDLSQFRHQAVWNGPDSAIEMRLVSLKSQVVHVAGRRFSFRLGETIHTESSRKYSQETFEALAGRAGWKTEKMITDPQRLFGIFLLTASE